MWALGGAPALRRSCDPWPWAPADGCAVNSKSVISNISLPRGCQLWHMSHEPYRVGAQEHLLAASLGSLTLDLKNQWRAPCVVLPKWATSRNAFDQTVDSQSENCLFHPGTSLTSLGSNTSTDISDTYSCPFLLLISHTKWDVSKLLIW